MSCEIDGYNEFEHITHPRARKEHKCCACREKIRTGDIYERIAFKWDGEFECLARCLRCSAIYDALVEKHRADPYSDQGVAYALDCGHEWDEFFTGPPPDEIARLAFMLPDEIQAEFAKVRL